EDVYFLFRKFCIDFAERMRIVPVKLTDEARLLILKYTWPGNVRQLKNAAEQVSILALDQTVTAEELVQIVPDITQSRLPALNEKLTDGNGSYSDRELLYKLIFDLKNDLNDLKQFVFNVVKNSELAHDVNVQNYMRQETAVNPVLNPEFSPVQNIHFTPS